MRRIALLGLTLLLPACQTVGDIFPMPDQLFGNPFVGAGGFLGDTMTTTLNPNRPIGDSPNMRRVMGIDAATDPLLPEAGNVWPGPPKPDPTLADIQREQSQESQPGTAPNEAPRPAAPPAGAARGSSTPPGSVQPSFPSVTTPPPPAAMRAPVIPPQPAPSTVGTVVTPQGAAVISNGANGIQTYTLPSGVSGRAISNGNGTITLIGPDGSVQSVPAPR